MAKLLILLLFFLVVIHSDPYNLISNGTRKDQLRSSFLFDNTKLLTADMVSENGQLLNRLTIWNFCDMTQYASINITSAGVNILLKVHPSNYQIYFYNGINIFIIDCTDSPCVSLSSFVPHALNLPTYIDGLGIDATENRIYYLSLSPDSGNTKTIMRNYYDATNFTSLTQELSINIISDFVVGDILSPFITLLNADAQKFVFIRYHTSSYGVSTKSIFAYSTSGTNLGAIKNDDGTLLTSFTKRSLMKDNTICILDTTIKCYLHSGTSFNLVRSFTPSSPIDLTDAILQIFVLSASRVLIQDTHKFAVYEFSSSSESLIATVDVPESFLSEINFIASPNGKFISETYLLPDQSESIVRIYQEEGQTICSQNSQNIEQKKDNSSSSSNSNLPVIIGASVGGAVLVAGVIVLIVCIKSKMATTANTIGVSKIESSSIIN